MKYTTYYEGKQIIDYTTFIQMKELMNQAGVKNSAEHTTVRKLKFYSDALHDMEPETFDHIPQFCLSMRNENENELYLEKKTRQNNMTYKTYEILTKKEVQNILDGNVEWMKNHSIQLFAEFYLHYTVNALKKGYITEVKKETYPYQSKGYLIFNTQILRAMKWNADFFDPDVNMMECLSCDKILAQYKQKATMPMVVAGMLNITAEQHIPEAIYSL